MVWLYANVAIQLGKADVVIDRFDGGGGGGGGGIVEDVAPPPHLTVISARAAASRKLVRLYFTIFGRHSALPACTCQQLGWFT